LATRLVSWLGLGASKYFAWKQRYGKVNDHATCVSRITGWSRESSMPSCTCPRACQGAVLSFAKTPSASEVVDLSLDPAIISAR
jgi:hypothetical protein